MGPEQPDPFSRPDGVVVLVKVCCIATEMELRLAAELGADMVGLVSAMPSGPGVIEDELIAALAESATAMGIQSVLLTRRVRADEILEQHERLRTDALQLVDPAAVVSLEELRRGAPRVQLIQVVHVDGGAREVARRAEDVADMLLLDSGRPDAAVRELGGTGRTHDWNISAEICAAAHVPVLLAGGLTSKNVRKAIARVRPGGVDVCSGVRAAVGLDRVRLDEFMSAVRRL